MFKKIASIPIAASLVVAGGLLLASPASADDDHWGFSIGHGGLGFYYDDHDYHHGHHYDHHYRHGSYGHHYYRPHWGYNHHYYQPYRHYYSPRWRYPGGFSFHFD